MVKKPGKNFRNLVQENPLFLELDRANVFTYTDQLPRPANNIMVQLVNITVVFSYYQYSDFPDVGSQTGAV